MQNYIKQLLLEIKEATQKVSARDSGPKSFEEEMEFIERYVSEDPAFTIGEQLHLDEPQFPNASLLSDKEVKELTHALKQLYYHCGVILELPDSLPFRDTYAYYVRALNEKCFLSYDAGHMHLEFCNYIPEECPFGPEHCSCNGMDDFSYDMDSDVTLLQSKWTEMDWEVLRASVSSKYVLQLIEDIELAYDSLQKEYNTIELFEYDEEEEEFVLQNVKKSIAAWLGISLEQFPIPSKISKEDAHAITLFLFRPWNRGISLIDSVLKGEDAIATYAETLSFFGQTARFDEETLSFYLDPLLPEELDKIIEEMPEVLDDPAFDEWFNADEEE